MLEYFKNDSVVRCEHGRMDEWVNEWYVWSHMGKWRYAMCVGRNVAWRKAKMERNMQWIVWWKRWEGWSRHDEDHKRSRPDIAGIRVRKNVKRQSPTRGAGAFDHLRARLRSFIIRHWFAQNGMAWYGRSAFSVNTYMHTNKINNVLLTVNAVLIYFVSKIDPNTYIHTYIYISILILYCVPRTKYLSSSNFLSDLIG